MNTNIAILLFSDILHYQNKVNLREGGGGGGGRARGRSEVHAHGSIKCSQHARDDVLF